MGAPRSLLLGIAIGSLMPACVRHAERRAASATGTTLSPDGSTRESVERVEPRGPRSAEQLPVDGHLPAPLLVPSGTPPAGGFPVLVIAHGAGGRGEHHCGFWNEALGPDWIIVCPTGALLDRRDPNGGAYFPDHFRLRAELGALVAALRARFSEHLTERFRFMGYSQGATMGALAIVGEMDVFDELVLIEGGGENWTSRRARSFSEQGGRRIILGCGTKGCAAHARRSLPLLEGAGLRAAFADAPGGGHTYGGSVGQAVHDALLAWDAAP